MFCSLNIFNEINNKIISVLSIVKKLWKYFTWWLSMQCNKYIFWILKKVWKILKTKNIIISLLGALSSYIIGFLKVDWKSWSNYFLCAGSSLSFIMLYVCYKTTSLNLVYIAYITYCFIFQSMNVVARYKANCKTALEVVSSAQ